jgi:hypothetical protein
MPDARGWLALLAAEPRPAGGPAEARARAHCVAQLAEHGYTVRESPFEYSTAPGRFATPVAGLVWIATIAATGHLGAHGHPVGAVALLVGVAVTMVIVGRWAARTGVLSLPIARARTINVMATRGTDAPRVWLMAHLDSKSQPIPILVRALGIAGTLIVWVAALIVAVSQRIGAPFAGWWLWVTLAGVATGLPVVASWVGHDSPGALDNASGVAAVMLAAARVPPTLALGVVLTSAEELGLAGARAFCRATARGVGGVVLNCDGVDDSGYLTVMYSGASRPERVIRVFAGVAAPRRLPVGVLVDAVACTDAGWDAVTVSRGTAATVARIHSSRDSADRLTGAGIESAATALAAAAQALA